MDDPSAEIPADLIAGLVGRVSQGRVALVLGADLAEAAGLAGWRQILGGLATALGRRDARAGSEAAALLKKKRLAAAAGLLARALGDDACEAALAEAWTAPETLPEAARLPGRLPVRAVWTTLPAELVARCVAAGSPAGWPEARVVGSLVEPIDPHRRHILPLLGAPGSGPVVAPAAARRLLAGAPGLRAVLGELYAHGTLVLVGFRPGDPDLALLLERLLVGFLPPEGTPHLLVASGVPALQEAELAAEHGLAVVASGGMAFLAALAAACERAGLSLARARPAEDDLAGWVARATEDRDDPEAQAALVALAGRARAAGRGDRLVELLVHRVELAPPGPPRAATLVELAHAFEKDVGDLPRAFTSLCAAVRESPADASLLAEAERLAAETDSWATLVADLAEIVPQVADRRVAAGLCVRLGRWYTERLHHDEYALASYREAIRLDPGRAEARAGLEALYRKAQRWGELAELLAARAESDPEPASRVAALLALGELHDHALASPGRAADAYERVVALVPGHDEALDALERIYRRGELWGKLAAVLERRAAVLDATDPARVAAARKELADLRADKLGDLEGAIVRLEAALRASDRDVEALRSLAGLYERLGRTDEHLSALERLAEVGPEGERAALLRRIAAEVEDLQGGAVRAGRAYERILALDPTAAHAYRGLERLHRRAQDWEALARLLGRQLAAAPAAERAGLHARLGRLLAEELADPARAIEAYAQAVALAPDDDESLAALARLHERVEAWDLALALVERQAARASGPAAAALWYRAAVLLELRLGDAEGGRTRLERAVEADPGHLPALLALAAAARGRGDWARALGLLLQAEPVAPGRGERLALLFEAAVIADERLEQPRTALELYARVLATEPEHVEAGLRAAGHWIAAGAWAQAEPVLEMLVRKVDAADRPEVARRSLELGAAATALGRSEKAVRAYRAAVEADAASLPAALGLAAALAARGEHAEAERALREHLARQRPTLAPAGVVQLWSGIAAAARARGDRDAAADALRRALEVEPGHRPTLALLCELAAERADWRAVERLRREALAGAPADERPRLLEELGDVLARKLGEPGSAGAAYREALELRPGSHALLHKLLDLHTEARAWGPAVAVLDRLAAVEQDPRVRAKYGYTAGLIAREELGDADEAVLRFGRALDDVPALPRAFEAIEELLVEREDWKGLARALRAQLKRLGERATPAELLPLWTRLGDVAAEQLGERDAAIAAYEVAAALEPESLLRHEQLAGLYLAAGPAQEGHAAAELQLLLRRAPDRLETYQRLHGLYRATGQRDRSFCLAQVLAFLGHASDEQRRELEAGRPGKPAAARRRLTEELWLQAVVHPREDRRLAALFGLLSGALAATTALGHAALGLTPRDQARADDPQPAASLFRQVAGLLGLAPVPALYLRARGEGGVQVVNVAEKGALAPAVVVGEPHLTRAAAGETAFELGKRLSYLRPERYVFLALPSVPRLEAALAAALVAAGVAPPTKEPDVEKLTAHLTRTVPAPVLAHVAALARKHAALGAPGAVASAIGGWVVATDLTANRVGLIVANDLETAARAVATERGAVTTLSAKERLRDLVAYAASDEYFAVRAHLGLGVEGAS